ncbi:hypothetical protein N8131_00265 [Flavobacteriaceae bacterium]|jgi:hypothetical protein|nr:hypothetical protein [Flavobacteriaceae bacterium]
MIHWEDNNIAYFKAESLIQNKEIFFSTLTEREGFDLILDCKNYLFNLSEFEYIALHQQKEGNCFVLILSSEQSHNLPSEWIAVPTKKEALDFISFEQMQRDLGF